MSSQPLPPPQTLLAHRRFLRAIVRSLLRGADGEDDVVQEALVRAWQTEPEHAARWTAWLGRIARNLSFDHLRAARRERRLRRGVAERAPAPSADEVLQQEEQRRRVVHAVLALPQPYRSVVLLRYWEELSPAQIAARLDVPGATVRSQLKRGLAMLRERLDADYGARGAWFAALTPFAGVGSGTAAGTTPPFAWGTLLMTNAKLAPACAALLLAGLGIWFWLRGDGAPASAPGSDAATPTAATPAVAAAVPPAAVPEPAAAPATARVAAAPDGELTVRGQVLSRKQPYPGLPLTLQWFDGLAANGTPTAEFAVECDDEGRFAWRGPLRATPGTVVAIAKQPALRLWCTGELVLPGQRDVVLDVSVLVFDRVLFGVVHDAAGAPIAGAVLNINGFAETEVQSDGSGTFEMRVPAPGYPLLVRARGYRQRLIQGYLPADAMRERFDVELLPGASIAGRVVDGEHAPVVGARVRASLTYNTVETGADGTFVIDGVPAGERIIVTAAKPGFQHADVSTRASDAPLEVVLQPGLRVALHVVDRNAVPVVGATVNVVYNPPMGAWTRRGVSDLDGHLTLDDLPAKAVEVIVERPGFVTVQRTVDAREQQGELALVLQPGCTLVGQVVDQLGQPVVGASLYCQQGTGDAIQFARSGAAMLGRRMVGSRCASDTEGRFEITGLPAEPCTLFAHHPDYNRAELALVGGAVVETVVRMQRAPAVAGRVLDGVTGAPIPAFSIRLDANEPIRRLSLDATPFRSDDGSFLLRNWELQTGVPLSATVTADGYAPAHFRTEAVDDPAPDQNVVRLFAGTRVEGVVRDPDSGRPVAGVTVALVRDDPMRRPNEGPATDASGRFAIDSVPPGEQRLRLQHPDRPELVFGPFVVGAGPGTLEVQPRMGNGVALRGRVTGAADAAGLEVLAYRADGRIAKGTVRADLTFEVNGLGAGRTMVHIADRTQRARTLRIEVGDHDVEGLEFPLRAGTGAVRVDLDTSGAARGEAQLRRADASAGGLDTIDDVVFTASPFMLDGLAPGRYRIDVHCDDGKRGRGEIDVGNGEIALRIECRERK